MFCLYAGKLNDDMCDRAKKLKDEIIMFEVEENRELNQRWEEHSNLPKHSRFEEQ